MILVGVLCELKESDVDQSRVLCMKGIMESERTIDDSRVFAGLERDDDRQTLPSA